MVNAACSQLRPPNPGLQTQLPSLLHSTGSEPTGLQLQAREKRRTNRKLSCQANSRNWSYSKDKRKIESPRAKNPSLPLLIHIVLDSFLGYASKHIPATQRGLRNHLASLFGVCVWMKRHYNSSSFLVALIYFLPLNHKPVGYSADTLALLTGKITFLLGLYVPEVDISLYITDEEYELREAE